MALESNFDSEILQRSQLGNLIVLDEEAERLKEIQPYEFSFLIDRLKNQLKREGIGVGSKVVLILPNSLNFCLYLFAAWELGACVIPLSPLSTIIEVKDIILRLSPKLVVWQDGKQEFLKGIELPQTPCALIMFTSGSSGKPKGVMISKEALLMKFSCYKKYLKLQNFETTLCSLPLNFGHGLISNFLFPLLSGCTVVLTAAGESRIFANWGNIIDEYKISALSSVPSILKMVGNFSDAPKNSSLKKAFCASAFLSSSSAELFKNWSSGLEVNQLYGMTELASWFSGKIDGETFKEGNLGRAWDAEIKIITEDKDDLSDSKIGEILVKSNYHMINYYDDPINSSLVLSKEGWLRTGDIGYLNELGEIQYIGRNDNVINIAGLKTYPEEVNRILRMHPEVLDSVTVGRKNHKDKLDYAIGAIMVLKENSLMSSSDISEFCKNHLNPQKIPSQIKFVKSIPLNSRGKVDLNMIDKIFNDSKLS